jgi:hypothetical protein
MKGDTLERIQADLKGLKEKVRLGQLTYEAYCIQKAKVKKRLREFQGKA